MPEEIFAPLTIIVSKCAKYKKNSLQTNRKKLRQQEIIYPYLRCGKLMRESKKNPLNS